MEQNIGSLFDQELYRSINEHYKSRFPKEIGLCSFCYNGISDTDEYYDFGKFLLCDPCLAKLSNPPSFQKGTKDIGICSACIGTITNEIQYYDFEGFFICDECIYKFKKFPD